jgi:EAL domain-containing protein (putative c-di-GMP-specific phosphodiesterase class I)
MKMSLFKFSLMRGVPLWAEIAGLVAAGAVLFLLLAEVEAFEELYEFSRAHEDWDIDEIIMVFPVMTLLLTAFAFNRMRDAHDRLAAQRELEAENLRLVTTDAVTGLPNRDSMLRSIDRAIVSAGPHAAGCVALLRSNARLLASAAGGQADAKSAIRQMSMRIAGALPAGAIMGSHDPDTFILFLPGSEGDAERQLETIRARAGAVMRCSFQGFLPACRVGARGLTGVDRDFDGALAEALAALEKTDAIRFHRTEDDAVAEARRAMVQRVVAMVADNRFDCVFQPIIELRTGETVAFEALSRWPADDVNPLTPDVFVPVIEDAGLVDAFTDGVLDRALGALKDWPAGVSVSVNVSRSQLQGRHLVGRIQNALQAHGVPGSRLQIEITETSELVGVVACEWTISALRDMGVTVAVDDFGAGYANLNLLHDIDFDCIKVDRKIISDLLVNAKDKAIVEAMVTMTRSMGRSLTAEGVENQQTASALTELGVDRAQGWHFSRPLARQAAASFARANGRKVMVAAA